MTARSFSAALVCARLATGSGCPGRSAPPLKAAPEHEPPRAMDRYRVAVGNEVYW
jgi:hypothetical protein